MLTSNSSKEQHTWGRIVSFEGYGSNQKEQPYYLSYALVNSFRGDVFSGVRCFHLSGSISIGTPYGCVQTPQLPSRKTVDKASRMMDGWEDCIEPRYSWWFLAFPNCELLSRNSGFLQTNTCDGALSWEFHDESCFMVWLIKPIWNVIIQLTKWDNIE